MVSNPYHESNANMTNNSIISQESVGKKKIKRLKPNSSRSVSKNKLNQEYFP